MLVYHSLPEGKCINSQQLTILRERNVQPNSAQASRKKCASSRSRVDPIVLPAKNTSMHMDMGMGPIDTFLVG